MEASWHYLFVFVALCLLVSGVYTDEDDEVDVHLAGENVCIEQTIQNSTVNVTYLQSVSVKEYTWCVQIPPRCPEWRTKMVTRYKEKEVSRVINHQNCCPGYSATGEGVCEPVCDSPCVRGTCVEPETCSCDPGFSGPTCSEVGCKDGNWGPDCANPCPCLENGRCEPNTGKCICLPGWEGLHCTRRCNVDRYGEGCNSVCDCTVGHRCHHVTGDCNPCSSGTFGMNCAEECSCSANGTALCYHENGNCFCKTNFYGRKCEMYCPFGYLNGVCHQTPLTNGFCSCASDLYRCDEELGCVCKDGFDCAGGTQIIDFASLRGSSADGHSSSHTQAIAIVAVVLILAVVLTVLLVVYYRRRLNRVEKDLQNRSVLYIENSALTADMQARKHDMVIRNVDPYDHISSNRIQNNTMEMATGGSAAASEFPAVDGAMAATPKPEKNVNIDRFKLGEGEGDLAAAAATADEPAGDQDGAVAMPMTKAKVILDDEEDEAAAAEAAYMDKAAAFDINLYEEYSPSKEKNNTKLADLYKKQVNKENINVVINNISGAGAEAEAGAGAVVAADSGSSGDDLLVEEDFDDMKANLHTPSNSNRNDRDAHDDRGA